MPVYDMNGSEEAVRELQLAAAEEADATKSLLELMQKKAPSDQLKSATERMESAHSKKMDAYEKLQAFRIDKD